MDAEKNISINITTSPLDLPVEFIVESIIDAINKSGDRSVKINTEKLDPIYCTDDYPREGCRIIIDIPGDTPGRNWHVGISPPKKFNFLQSYLESYAASSLKGALTVARCLAKGEAVPKNYHLI